MLAQIMDESGRFREENFAAMHAEAAPSEAVERSSGQTSTSGTAELSRA